MKILLCPALVALLVVIVVAGKPFAADLPVCSNRVINEVTARVGCTVGDAKCWLTRGGFCMDYVGKRARSGRTAGLPRLVPISLGKIKKGDVAQFNSRAHYAYIEAVLRNAGGKPVAVNLSEYNYGTCYVDEDSLVTDKYMVVNRRSGVPIDSIDGGFLRPQYDK